MEKSKTMKEFLQKLFTEMSEGGYIKVTVEEIEEMAKQFGDDGNYLPGNGANSEKPKK